MEADRGRLVLTRKAGERIHIDDDIVLEFTQCKSGRTTVAVIAPKSRRILRGEIHDLLNQEPAASPATEQG